MTDRMQDVYVAVIEIKMKAEHAQKEPYLGQQGFWGWYLKKQNKNSIISISIIAQDFLRHLATGCCLLS